MGGAWIASSSPRTLDVHNPATGDMLCRVPMSGQDDVDRAVTVATQAFATWRRVPTVQRARVLFRFKNLLERASEELARTITIEHGKTLDEARSSVRRGIENVEHACGIPSLMMGETLEDVAAGHRLRVLPPADRRVRRHHAFQLPGHGADVVLAVRGRHRQHVHPQAVGAGAAVAAAPVRDRARGRIPGRRGQPRVRRPRGGAGARRSPGRGRAVVRRLDPDGARRLPGRGRARQARAGARRGQEPRGGRAGRRPRSHGRLRHREQLRLRRAEVPGRQRGRRRRRRGRRAEPPPRRRGSPHRGRQRARARRQHGAAGVRTPPRPRGLGSSTSASRRARSFCSTAAAWRSRAIRAGTGWARRSSTVWARR